MATSNQTRKPTTKVNHKPTMCCGDKCLFFINIRTGSLIFGYITAIISGLGTIISAGFAMYLGILLMFPDRYELYTSGDNYSSNNGISTYTSRITITKPANQSQYCAEVIIITMYFIEFLSSFVSSILLLVGITKKKPSLLKTFIVYGLVQVVLLMTFFIMLHCVTSFFSSGYVLLAAAILGVYSMCIYMIFLVYQSMSQQNLFENPALNTGL